MIRTNRIATYETSLQPGASRSGYQYPSGQYLPQYYDLTASRYQGPAILPIGYAATSAAQIPGQTSISYAQVPLTVHDVTDVCDILKKAGFKPSDWESLATRLRIDDPGSITHHDLTLRLGEVLRQWINSSKCIATWMTLATEVSKVSGYGEGTERFILKLATERAVYRDQGSASQRQAQTDVWSSELLDHKLGSRIDLVNEVWYHGNMTSEGARQALSTTSDGTFLVRDSARYRGQRYVLSVKNGVEVSEFYIVVTSDSSGNAYYEIQGTNYPFHSLPALVKDYRIGERRISVDGEILKQPYQRWNNFLAEDERNTDLDESFQEHKTAQPVLAGQEETDYEIQKHGWYHYKVAAQNAHERLTMASEGSYFVHDSNYPGCYTLWVKYGKNVTPFLIESTVTPDRGEILYFVEKTGMFFSTVDDLVSHYTKNPLPWPGHLLLKTPRMRPGWKTETNIFGVVKRLIPSVQNPLFSVAVFMLLVTLVLYFLLQTIHLARSM